MSFIFRLLINVANLKSSCFPHVINIAVKTGLKYLMEIDDRDPEAVGSDEPFLLVSDALLDDPEYLEILENDIVGEAQNQVTTCRASGQRRENFKRVIEQGNKDGGWGEPAEELAPIQLLKDVDTRWSSIFQMIDRLMELYLVSQIVSSQCFTPNTLFRP